MQTAVRFHPSGDRIRVEQVPLPIIQHPDDAIVKVQFAGLCGSDLHVYRGHSPVDQVHTCGHEFIGEVVELGSNFSQTSSGRPSLYSTLKVGHKVVSPFTVNCGECHVCRVGFTSRCLESKLFGSPVLEGAQAQYVRVPKAGGTLFDLSDPDLPSTYPALTLSSISDGSLVFLADILPTGIFAVYQTLNHPKLLPFVHATPWPVTSTSSSPSMTAALQNADTFITFAVIGLGPVGVCAAVALVDALETKGLRGNYRIVAIDVAESRLSKMMAIYEKMNETEKGKGGEGYAPGSFVVKTGDDAKEWVKEGGGVGCNAVLEVVGHDSAMSLAFDLVRPFGLITSVGIHAGQPLSVTGRAMYDKNVSLDFGRCPARAMLPMSFELLAKRQDVFGGIGGEATLLDRVAGLGEAADMYRAFDKGEVGKVLFNPWI